MNLILVRFWILIPSNYRDQLSTDEENIINLNESVDESCNESGSSVVSSVVINSIDPDIARNVDAVVVSK